MLEHKDVVPSRAIGSSNLDYGRLHDSVIRVYDKVTNQPIFRCTWVVLEPLEDN